jgi:hypothetical protein
MTHTPAILRPWHEAGGGVARLSKVYGVSLRQRQSEEILLCRVCGLG